MTQSYDERLSEIFREIEIDLGSTKLSVLVLESLYDAVKGLKKQDLHHFFAQLQELAESVEATKPKYAIIIDSLYEVLRLAYAEDILHPEAGWPLNKEKFLKQLKRLIKRRKTEKSRIVKQSSKIKLSGKTILLFHHSGSVEAVLAAAKRKKQRFKVIVAEQDPDKTGEIIEFLSKNRIPFKVVPSYMISHVEDDIDMLFLGALTLKSTMDFVMDPGTHSLASEFHLLKKPIYVFLSTTKFSLWKGKKRAEVFKHVSRRIHPIKQIRFERIKFSHDRVELKLIDKVVTEEGVFKPAEIKEIYKDRLKERLKLEKRIELLG